MKYLLFFAQMTAFFLLTGCSTDDNPTPDKLTATEKLIKKKWGLTDFAIRTDNGSTYSLTKEQWQAMGVTLDNLTFRTDGRYSSNSSSGTYTLKQDDTVMELTNEPYYPYILTDLTISDYEFSGRSPVVTVNPQKPTITDEERGIALVGLGGLEVLKVDVSNVKTVQLILTYTGL
jgi:hypothetical protein